MLKCLQVNTSCQQSRKNILDIQISMFRLKNARQLNYYQ